MYADVHALAGESAHSPPKLHCVIISPIGQNGNFNMSRWGHTIESCWGRNHDAPCSGEEQQTGQSMTLSLDYKQFSVASMILFYSKQSE